jgi:hypothetical protein
MILLEVFAEIKVCFSALQQIRWCGIGTNRVSAMGGEAKMDLIDRILEKMLEKAPRDEYLLQLKTCLSHLGTNAKARRNALHKLLNRDGVVRGTHTYTHSYTTYIYTHTHTHIYTLIHTLTYTHTYTYIHTHSHSFLCPKFSGKLLLRQLAARFLVEDREWKTSIS